MAAAPPEEGGWCCRRSYCKAVNSDIANTCWKCKAPKPKLPQQRDAPQPSSILLPAMDGTPINAPLPSTTWEKSSAIYVTPTLASSDLACESALSSVRPEYHAPDGGGVVSEPRVGALPLQSHHQEEVITFPGEECRIVLMGKTGNGKSSTGNTILNLTGEGPKDRFVAKNSWGSVTKLCQLREGVRFGVRIKVVDTPGFFDTEHDQVIIDTEIGRCVGILSDGPHAVLLVIKLGNRFTKEEAQSVDQVRQLFGDDIMRHVIILFTHGDTVSSETDVAAEFGDMCPDSLKEVMQENRYVVFNNRGSPKKKDGQVRNLLLVIRDLLSATDDKPFTSPLLMRSESIVVAGARKLANLLQGKASGLPSRDLIRLGLDSEVLLSSQLTASLGNQKMDLQEVHRLLKMTMAQVSGIQSELQAEVEKERSDKERFLDEKTRLEQENANLKREKDEFQHRYDSLKREKDTPKQQKELQPKTQGGLKTGNIETRKTLRCDIL